MKGCQVSSQIYMLKEKRHKNNQMSKCFFVAYVFVQKRETNFWHNYLDTQMIHKIHPPPCHNGPSLNHTRQTIQSWRRLIPFFKWRSTLHHFRIHLVHCLNPRNWEASYFCVFHVDWTEIISSLKKEIVFKWSRWTSSTIKHQNCFVFSETFCF